jgi:hypothetical protein
MISAFELAVIMHNDVQNNCSHNTDFYASSQGNVSRQTHFSFHRLHLAHQLY